MNPLTSVWKEIDHPRDRLGRFRSKWSIKGPAKELLDSILETVNPRQFTSPQQANVYLNQRFEGGKPGGRKAVLDYLGNFRAINAEMKAGKNPPEADALRSSMKPLDDDLMLTQSTTPAAFGLDAQSLGLIEELTGKEIMDRTFTTAWLGGGTNNGGVTMHILAPRGTMAAHPGGVEVILSDRTPLRVTRVNQNPDGTYAVMAVALPEGSAPNAKSARESMLEGQREGNIEGVEQGLPESTEVMPEQDTSIPERMPSRNPAGADVLAPVEAKGTGDSPDGFEADGRQSWVKDGQPITIGPGRSGGEIGVYQGDRIIATAPDIEMLPQAAARADLPEVGRWARSNKQTPMDRMGASAKEAADRAATNRANSEGERNAQAERDAARKERERASDERWEGRDKKIAARQAEARKKLPKLADRKQEEKPEPSEEEKERRVKRLEEVRAAQPKFKPGDRGGVEDRSGAEIMEERNAPRPIRKLTKKAAEKASSGELIRSMREGRLTRAEARTHITERIGALRRLRESVGDSDTDVRAERIDARLVEEEGRLAEIDDFNPRKKALKKLAPEKATPAARDRDEVSEPVETPPAKKTLKKAAKAGPRGPQKGDVVEWTNPDGDTNRGEIVSRQRDGSVTVRWADTGRTEKGIDPNAASMEFRRPGEGDTPIPAKKALKKAVPAEKRTPAKKLAAADFDADKIARSATDGDLEASEIAQRLEGLDSRQLRKVASAVNMSIPQKSRDGDRWSADKLREYIATSIRRDRNRWSLGGDRPSAKTRERMAREREAGVPAKKLAKKATGNREDVMKRINSFEDPPTREDAREMVDTLSTPDLRTIGKDLNIPGSSRMKLDDLRHRIVEATAGRRRDSIAIRGFRGRNPFEDTPGDRGPTPRTGPATDDVAEVARIRAERDRALARPDGSIPRREEQEAPSTPAPGPSRPLGNVRDMTGRRPIARAGETPEREGPLATVTPLKRTTKSTPPPPEPPPTPPAKKATPTPAPAPSRAPARMPDAQERIARRNAAVDPLGMAGLSDNRAERDIQVENRIRRAYNDAVAEGARGWNGEPVNSDSFTPGVRMAEIRKRLESDMSRQEVDEAIRRLSRSKGVYGADEANQKTLTDEDRQSSVATNGSRIDVIQFDDAARQTQPVNVTAIKKALPSGRDEDDSRRQQSRDRAESLTERMDRLRAERERIQAEEMETQREVVAKQTLDAVKKALPTPAELVRRMSETQDDLNEMTPGGLRQLARSLDIPVSLRTPDEEIRRLIRAARQRQ